jgi:nucleoside 2-deoxyribosyltransferase
MDAEAGALRPEQVTYLLALHDALLAAGAAVFSAHRNEGWGRTWLPPEVCTPADFLAIRHCDVVCAVLGNPPSPGVLVELGWASALQKPVVVLVGNQSTPQLVRGLHRVTRTTIRVVPAAWDAEALSVVVDLVLRFAESPDCDVLTSTVAGYPATTLPLGYEWASA